MAAVTANSVFCRAPVASARAPRAAGASAARAGALPAPTDARVALAKGSPLAPYALGVAAPAARAARVPALRAITDTKDAAAEVEEKPEPALESDLGVDYTTFRDLLKAGEWEKADDEHRRLMCVLAGEDAEDRGWVYFTEARAFPVKDLKTIDNLWVHFSDGRYGFSVQRKIWVGQRRQWAKFFKQIDWTTGENNAYRKWPEEFIWKGDAAKGHMPLTNALRGTQLLEALLEHPAFAPPAKPKTGSEQMQDAAQQAAQGAQKAMGNAMKGLKGLKKPDWMK